jgi:hypothetical protein
MTRRPRSQDAKWQLFAKDGRSYAVDLEAEPPKKPKQRK